MASFFSSSWSLKKALNCLLDCDRILLLCFLLGGTTHFSLRLIYCLDKEVINYWYFFVLALERKHNHPQGRWKTGRACLEHRWKTVFKMLRKNWKTYPYFGDLYFGSNNHSVLEIVQMGENINATGIRRYSGRLLRCGRLQHFNHSEIAQLKFKQRKTGVTRNLRMNLDFIWGVKETHHNFIFIFIYLLRSIPVKLYWLFIVYMKYQY